MMEPMTVRLYKRLEDDNHINESILYYDVSMRVMPQLKMNIAQDKIDVTVVAVCYDADLHEVSCDVENSHMRDMDKLLDRGWKKT